MFSPVSTVNTVFTDNGSQTRDGESIPILKVDPCTDESYFLMSRVGGNTDSLQNTDSRSIILQSSPLRTLKATHGNFRFSTDGKGKEGDVRTTAVPLLGKV